MYYKQHEFWNDIRQRTILWEIIIEGDEGEWTDR
jgi:hypothetical protein